MNEDEIGMTSSTQTWTGISSVENF